MVKTTLKIDGMMCGMCEAHMNDLIRNLYQVKKVSSSASKGETVIVSEGELDLDLAKSEISKIGYSLLYADSEPYQKKKMTNEQYKQLSLKEFNKAAEKFDDNDPSIYNLCRKDYPDVYGEVIKEPFKDLLDAGCGTGEMIHLFNRDCPGKNYTGIDLSENMIQVAKRKNIENTEFVVGDCENFPFQENSFDVVTCSMSFHHYPDPLSFFESLNRVLRPGGRFILRDMATSSKIMMWLINRIEMPIVNTLAKKGDVHCYTREDIQKLCEKSGLTLEKYEIRKGFRLHCVVRSC